MVNELSRGRIYSNLMIYSTAHFAVDAACIAVTWCGALVSGIDPAALFTVVVIYNLLAFGFQPLFGAVVDHLERPRAAAVTGALLTAVAVWLTRVSPVAAVIVAGIGNAVFHLGGGTVCFSLDPGRASFPGIFVAPGAFGVYIGTLAGKSGAFPSGGFIISLAVLAVLMLWVKPPDEREYYRAMRGATKGAVSRHGGLFVVVYLMLFAVVVRSLVGACSAFPWKSDPALLLTLTLAVVAGKAAGGVLADRFGWAPVACGALALSAPLLSFFNLSPLPAILGAFLFNMAMPVTLAAVAGAIRPAPAFAFGLTCLALFIGALPSFTGSKAFFAAGPVPFTLSLLAAVAIFAGLRNFAGSFDGK